MTERLYYRDPLLRTFDGVVVACESRGDVFAVVLDRTAFYPTSGGQPYDVGTLGGARVREVLDGDDEEIRHVVETALVPGATVRGEIDWPRRLDHMQQHTGQHVLSAAFDRLTGARTVSFHLGADDATIDLAREVTAADVAAVEREANRVVWEDRPVTVRFVTADEAAALPLRKEPARTGMLRLIDIADFDLSACGGTHVPTTGRIGMIAVTGWERFKGGTRVGFVCGGRALTRFGTLRDIVTQATRALTIAPADLPAAVARIQDAQRTQSREVARLQAEVAASRAARLVAEAQDIRGVRYVLSHQPALDGAGLKTLASAIVSGPGVVTILAGAGQPTPVVAARSADGAFDAAAWVRSLIAARGGRGGGRPDIAQAGVPAAAEEILAEARRTLSGG